MLPLPEQGQSTAGTWVCLQEWLRGLLQASGMALGGLQPWSAAGGHRAPQPGCTLCAWWDGAAGQHTVLPAKAEAPKSADTSPRA